LTPKARAEAALLGTTFIWGSTFAIQKIGLQDISPLMLICVRFSIATVAFMSLFWRKLFPLPYSSIVKGSILGLFLFLGFAVQTIGLNYTTASKSAFITSMMVAFVPLLQFIVEKRSPNLGNIIGVLIVSLGLWFLTSPAGSTFNVGDALTLLCSILFGVYIVYLDVVSHEMSALQLTFLQTASTAILSLLSVLLLGSGPITISTRMIATVGYLTLFATVLTTYIQTRFQKYTTPTKAAIIFTIEPVVASAIAYIVLHERIGNLGVLGGGMIVTGVFLSELSDSIPWLRRTFEERIGP
jgi:drug/metabolite transporter (DMT)-like permease